MINMTNFNFQVTPSGNPKFEPSVAVNLLIPGIMLSVAVDESSGPPLIGLYRSIDGGFSWVNSLLPLPVGFNGAEAPVVSYGFPNIFIVSAHVFPGEEFGTTVVYKSFDNGATFSAPQIVGPGFGSYINNDETNCYIDTSQTSPYIGNMYVTYNRQFNVDNGGNSVAFFNRSKDNGTTWEQPVLISSEADRVERPDISVDLVGAVDIAYVTTSPSTNFIVRQSFDGGATFANGVVVSNVIPVPSPLPVVGWNFRVLTFASISTDRSVGPNTGAAYAIWQDYRLGYSDVFMSKRTPDTNNWSNPVSITGAPAGSQNFFPVVDVDPLTGVVNVIYYSNQINGFDLDVYVARSINGGATFTNTRITNVSFNPNASSPTPVPLIGDYIDIVSVPPGGYIGVWMDTTPGTFCIFAGYSDVIIP
ncbi:hypothetical protein SAMN05518855_1004163 [Paenibacillus sp. CF384]|nr:hypothetical protein SAMN05518855_1004163 [Paenibacillus sp. CF384]